MGNMELYNSVRAVPPEAQKEIRGGRLSGMTDINPMWRIQQVTEVFGPCGTGWKYDIVKMFEAPSADGEVAVFVQIEMRYKMNGEWSDAVVGIGGSKLIQKEKGGLYFNDEAYKMALTDALGVAFKALGVGADIYWQQGTKYTNPDAPAKPAAARPAAPQKPAPKAAPARPAASPAAAAATGDAAKAADTVINFGKHKGETLRQVYKTDKDYFDYLMGDLNTNDYIKKMATLVFNAAAAMYQKKKPAEPPLESATQSDIPAEDLP